MYQNPKTGMKKKKEYEQNIELSEAFLEAVPTAFLLFSLWQKTPGKYNSHCRTVNSVSDLNLYCRG